MGGYVSPGLSPIHTKDPKNISPLDLPGYVSLILYDGHPLKPATVPTIYRPTSSSFPAWDFILHVPPADNTHHRILFCQSSIQLFTKHDLKAVKDSKPARKESLTARSIGPYIPTDPKHPKSHDHVGGIVSTTIKHITGLECATSMVGEEPTVTCASALTVDFIYLTTTSKKECEEDSKLSMVKGLKILSLEELRKMDPMNKMSI